MGGLTSLAFSWPWPCGGGHSRKPWVGKWPSCGVLYEAARLWCHSGHFIKREAGSQSCPHTPTTTLVSAGLGRWLFTRKGNSR